ncbi:MAG: UvrD-helicase domain-containing protein, partial [Gemmatimonadota bacterium]
GAGRLFLVGDPKQSIYGFRRADIQVYNRFRDALLSGDGCGLTLVRNFRSRPDLIAAVNGLFEGVLPGGEDFSPSYATVVANRQDPGTGDAATLYTLGEDAAEGEFVAALVRRIVGGVAVGGKGGSPERPATWRDVAVLYRSDTGGEVVAGYRRAFARAGIPHVVSARRGFYARQEVQDLRMVLSAIDAPADPAALYAALKTIFFGLRDAEILPLFERGAETLPARTADALALLARFSARRGRASLSDLVAELYRETGVEFTAARLPEGDRIVQNLAKAAGLARAFEWAAGGSVKAFVADLRRRTEEDRQENEFPSFDEGEDVVQVSTIHASKGLEFPVVILANLSRGGRRGVDGLRTDRVRGLSAVIFPGFRTYSAFRQVPVPGGSVTFEEWERRKQAAEEARLLYVAATRARDRLYLVQGARGQGSDLSDALARGLSRAADGGESRCAVTGLPGRRRVFGPEGPGPGGRGGVLHVTVDAPLEAAAVRPPAAPDIAFAEEPVQAPEAPPRPPAPVSLGEFHDRERGKRFGDKVHLLLEAAPPVASPWPPPGAPPQAIAWEDGEEARWREIAARIAASPFRAALSRTALVGTEVPLLACRGGRADEERADLVVRAARPGGPAGGGEEFWIVDYKTGRERGEEESHVRQLRGYVAILAAAWGVPVRGFIWYLESDETVEVDGS